MKKQFTLYSVITLTAISLTFCKKKDSIPAPVYGCTDPTSINYNSTASIDDGSCQYKKRGCMDPISSNYDSTAQIDDGSCQYAGPGGNVNIVAFPQHHGQPIFNYPGKLDTAFIKYNTMNSPGTAYSDYDIILVGDSGEDHVHIPNMKPGKYYILMAGYDSTISAPVKGGVPFIVTQTTGDYDLVVPVAE